MEPTTLPPHDVPRQRGIPRLSRLPRATGTVVHVEGTPKDTQIPRPGQINGPALQSTSLNYRKADSVTGTKFGWTAQSGKARQEPLESISISHSYRVQRTPRTLNGHHESEDEKHGEYETVPRADGSQDTSEPGISDIKRKNPRPSLSERTIETMSQVPLSPSPSRRKSSISGVMNSMPPPLRQSSPTGRRSPEVKQLKSPTSRPSTTLVPPMPVLYPLQTASTLYSTPIRSKTQRIERVPSSVQHPSTGTASRNMIPVSTPKTAPAAHKVRSLRDLKAVSKQTPTRKASLNFKDITTSHSNEFHELPTLQASSLPARARPPNAATPSKLRKRPSLLTGKPMQVDTTTEANKSIKSSASLRETIARAKAAKKQTNSLPVTNNDEPPDTLPVDNISSQSLRRRVQNAVTSGVLNVAALGLKKVPEEIMRMYDYSDGSNQNWSEAVDLTKFIIADNDLEELPDTVFPDWTIEELQENEDKSNIFAGLEILDLRGNNLTQLPVGLRRLERLHTLNLGNNKLPIGAIETICQLTSLKDLCLANNNLTGALPSCIDQLTQLYALDLHDNKLTSVDTLPSSLTQLRKCNLSGNLLEDLPVSELEQMPIIHLDASRNRLSSFTPKASSTLLTTLQNLNISSNELKTLWKDAACPQLQSLIVDNNQLASLPYLVDCSKLITLTASQNRLEDLPDGFVDLQALRTANFSGNNIRVLDPYISRMENLSVCNLASNPLRDRKYLTMSTPDLKADLAKRLTAVYVREGDNTPSGGELHSQDPTATNLVKVDKGHLDLSSRGMMSVDLVNIDMTGNVSTLDLSGNKLQMIPLQVLGHDAVQDNLRTLTLAHNTTFDPTSYVTSPIDLTNLRSLSLASTGIVSTDALSTFVSAPLLTDLNLCCNRLKGPLPMFRKTFPALTTLLISDNELTSITPSSISGLEVLDVRNNDIEFLPPKIGELGNSGDEKKSGRLRTFECSGNKFRVPRLVILEKGTEAILRDLRRMVITDELGEEWRE